MAYEEKNMEGGLFVNRDRTKDTHPHATGYIIINDKKFQLSAWTNTSASGNKWQKIVAQPWVEKEKDDDGSSQETEQNSTEAADRSQGGGGDQGEGTGRNIDDEIPF